jgi:hypothetical protein
MLLPKRKRKPVGNYYLIEKPPMGGIPTCRIP